MARHEANRGNGVHLVLNAGHLFKKNLPAKTEEYAGSYRRNNMTTHVKNSTQRLALLWVVICHFTANAAEPVFNDFTGRAKLGDLVAQYTGYSNAVSAA